MSLSKTELAMRYSPNITPAAALKRLQRWIALNKGLSDALAQTGYVQSQRVLTNAQEELFYRYLGDP